MQEPGSPEGAPGPVPGAGAEAGEASGPPGEAPGVGEGVPHRAVGTSGRVFGGRGAVCGACLSPFLLGSGPPSARTLPRPRKKRTVYLKEQLQELEKHFWANRYPSYQERAALAAGLNLDEHQVQVWFKNRRAKHSRLPKGRGQGASAAAPGGCGAGVPQCVPAPPPVLVPARVPEHAPGRGPCPCWPRVPWGPRRLSPRSAQPPEDPPCGRARHLQPEHRPAGPAGLPGVRPGCTNPSPGPGSHPRPASGMLRLRHLARRRRRASPQFHSGCLPPRPLGGIPFPLDGPVPGGRRPCRGQRLGLCY
ncbi:homeobox protein MIXL1 [Felis catus]|uniref:homeobox protein MIXL1 n=1 Tax=Felis catus TaxID=9685 RepID=UPI001D19F7BF|nr:homeobox protein MIXL1 [Felis catus]